MKLAFIDVETTGLDPKTHELLEVAVVLAECNEGRLDVIVRFCEKVLPEHIWTADAQALRVNGYDEYIWEREALAKSEVMPKVVELVRDATIVGHHIGFDLGFLTKDVSDVARRIKVDTVSLCWGLFVTGKVQSLSLDSLCKYYSIVRPEPHSALADAMATLQLTGKVLRLFTPEKDLVGA